ncbi:hypothetical protein CFC21_004396 [Triticum aestivum]|uniref:NB-ARC domain-containing protein n=1 Tax=Triticum aestivum TaxID=4565 RepID=A0A3B5Y7H7_WHEAT|nr:hypothetical protein CFC21_004396 [Triticum aestivum]
MNAALEKMEFMDELDPVARDWRDHVREMSYDMENCIDDFVRQFGDGNAKLGFIKKTVRSLKMLGQRHRIADRMEELKVLALEANERRIRYKIDEFNPNSSPVAIDPRLSAIYTKAAGLVGTDGPKKELVNLLTSTAEKELKVVSIVGFGGLGKTTLAKQVYDEIRGQFDHTAFVSISQKPNMTGLLYRIQLKLGMNWSCVCEVEDITDDLRNYLTHKRYLIIVDDLWDQSAWNTISRAFPPLNKQDSKKLFFGRVYGSEDDRQFEEITAEILKKCGGLPLAIITIASLLASRPKKLRDEWERIRNSLGTQFSVNPTLEGVKNILNLSYIHLPLHLRACFLHLGIYPEDRAIERDDLVRQWSAEGLVRKLHGQDSEVVAKSYFNELINRSLIQPGRIEYEIARDHDRKYKVHRISMNFSNGGAADETSSRTIPSSLSQVRSLALFGESKYMPTLLHFKHLRVFLFESLVSEPIDLTAISQLVQLRYLRIISNPSYTSDMLCSVSEPFRHIKVLNLSSCRMPRVPKWICGLQCLCRLELNVDTCTDELHALGELPSLVHLSLQICSIPEDSAVTFSAGSFPVLEYCKLEPEYDVTAYLAFGAGAMPKLTWFRLYFNNWGGATPVGLEHLLSLKYVKVIIRGPEEVENEAESAFRNCMQQHPNRPEFDIYSIPR